MKITPFARRVYRATLRIPLGQVRTYKWVAVKAGNPKAVRAVGQILKRNPFPLLVPCHRVVRSDGDIGGYARGKKVKATLLDLEQMISKTMV